MEDLIRRSDAIAILKDLQSKHLQFCLVPFRIAIEKVQAIPSAESTGDLDNAICEYVKEGLMANPYDRPQGEWRDLDGNFVPLDEDGCTTASAWCSNCGEWLTGSDEYWTSGRFCPSCGRRMRKE